MIPVRRTSSKYIALGGSAHQIHVWISDDLRNEAKALPVRDIPLKDIAELKRDMWFIQGVVEPTVQNVAEHARRIYDADLTCPIIISSQGVLLDGLHRVAKAFILGLKTISAVRFVVDPKPSYIVNEHELRELMARSAF